MRFAIYGAGAIGQYLGAQLHKSGHDVSLIARGDRLSLIRKEGIRLSVNLQFLLPRSQARKNRQQPVIVFCHPRCESGHFSTTKNRQLEQVRIWQSVPGLVEPPLKTTILPVFLPVFLKQSSSIFANLSTSKPLEA